MELGDIVAALRHLAVRETHREQAVRHLSTWWNDPRYAAFRPQLESLAQRQRWELLLDSFYRAMPFGTGGRRGPVGIGPNRINHDTIVTSVQGHVHYLRRRFPHTPLRVVVAFDVRIFRDLRGLYDAGVPNPLLGMRSRDFALLAAAVYAANDIDVYTVTGDDDFYLSTPELSFAIRHLHAHGGVNISASHNHPDDNGAKIYLASGGQPVPPDDEELADAVAAVTAVPVADFVDAQRAGRIKWWDAAQHHRYLEENLSRSIDRTARRAVIAYSPLHGTGRHTVGDLLPAAGFAVRFVEQQLAPDGAFPHVKFRMPNPEVPESMEQVIAEGRAANADAGFATDPDADRIGLVAPSDGTWRVFSGNEIAILLAAYIIETRREQGTLPAHAFVVKTAVTTGLLTRIATANGVQMLGDLLVGFKYIGQVLDEIAATGHFGAVHATPADFLLGAEESNGILVSPALRDKDATGGALLLAELCARLRQRGTTLDAYLTDIYRRYGYAANTGYSLVMEGLAGLERVGHIMDRLRSHPPHSVDGRGLEHVLDYWDEKAFGPIRSQTDRSSRNFIQLRYAGPVWVSVRPSGTEPKIKFYVEQEFEPQPSWAGDGFAGARRAMDEAAQEVTLSMVDQVLHAAGIALPRAALLVSSLVSIDNRIDFGEVFLPELEERLRQMPAVEAAALAAWIDTRLQAYGSDPRFLVKNGVAHHFDAVTLSAESAELLRQVFLL